MRGAGPARDGRRFNHGLTTVFAIVRRRRRDSGGGSERPQPPPPPMGSGRGRLVTQLSVTVRHSPEHRFLRGNGRCVFGYVKRHWCPFEVRYVLRKVAGHSRTALIYVLMNVENPSRQRRMIFRLPVTGFLPYRLACYSDCFLVERRKTSRRGYRN